MSTDAEERSDVESAEELYERAPCGYLSARPDGTVSRVNQTFLEWTGYTRDEIVGVKRVSGLLSVAGRIYYETHLSPLLRMQGAVREIALEIVTRGGRRIPVLINVDLRADALGQPIAMRLTVFDVTERRRYERELVAARRRAEHVAKAKADFLALISHEIRTPLNAIISVAHLLDRTGASESQGKYIRILRSSSSSLLALVDDVLDFSKIEAGKMTLDERSFSPAELIEGIVLGQEAKAAERGNTVRAELDPNLPPFLVGDPVKLGQVITNLVGNAVKFTRKGLVTIEVAVGDRTSADVRLRVAVRDTGIGIPPDRLATIFDDYEQAGADTSTKYGGTGLGLAISRRLLELHGTQLEVASTLGEGTTFSFDLRLRIGEPTATSIARSQATDGQQTLRGLRALVADDNEVNVFVVTRFLEAWAIDHDVVGDGAAALERARTGTYDLILMDLRMPEMDGFEATRAIRALQTEHRPVVIAMSASMRAGHEENIAASGFDDFVAKPFDPEQLYRKLALHTGRHLAVATETTPALTSWKGAAEVASQVDFDVHALRDTVSDEPRSRTELYAATARELDRTRSAVREHAAARDGQAVSAAVHRIRPTLEMIKAHSLWVALRRVSKLLDAAEPPVALLDAALLVLECEIDEISAALRDAARV